MGLDVGEIGLGLDLGLDLKLFAARSAGRLAVAKEAASMDACIRRLEEERGKIEVFGRELPLCVRLLADVIEVMKEEAEKKRRGDKDEAKEDGDKSKWMSTAQLWVDSRGRVDADSEKEKQEKESTLPSAKAHGGGAFVPFKAAGCGMPAFQPLSLRREEEASTVGQPDLSLQSPGVKSSPLLSPAAAAAAADDSHRVVSSGQAARATPATALNLQPHPQPQHQQQMRKTRRCWSPELHQQFVAALHELGGAHVATPKQIREVMKVDGLTNDEVKSHLQKYRLHNRRAPGSAAANQPIVLLGGLWVSQEQSSSLSGSPQRSHQFSGSGVAASAATVGDSCEDEDKSESYSWK